MADHGRVQRYPQGPGRVDQEEEFPGPEGTRLRGEPGEPGEVQRRFHHLFLSARPHRDECVPGRHRGDQCLGRRQLQVRGVARVGAPHSGHAGLGRGAGHPPRQIQGHQRRHHPHPRHPGQSHRPQGAQLRMAEDQEHGGRLRGPGDGPHRSVHRLRGFVRGDHPARGRSGAVARNHVGGAVPALRSGGHRLRHSAPGPGRPQTRVPRIL